MFQLAAGSLATRPRAVTCGDKSSTSIDFRLQSVTICYNVFERLKTSQQALHSAFPGPQFTAAKILAPTYFPGDPSLHKKSSSQPRLEMQIIHIHPPNLVCENVAQPEPVQFACRTWSNCSCQASSRRCGSRWQEVCNLMEHPCFMLKGSKRIKKDQPE